MILSHTDSTRRKVFAITGMVLAGFLASFYLAGYFFLLKLHNAAMPPMSATPLTVFDYWHYYGNEPYTRRWLTICLICGCVPVFVGVGALLAPVRRSLHGDARFATRREVEDAALFGEHGLILGKWGGKFIMLGKQMAAFIAAPPRSGKGAGLVQPNALNWWGSFVVLDIRKECWRITAGWRATFSKTHLFDPLAENGLTAQWNCLSYLRTDRAELLINDIQKLANQLSPDPAAGDPFWPASCRDLFLGLALYVFETPDLPRTMGEILDQIMFGDEDAIGDHWKKIIKDRDAANLPLSNTCKAMLFDFIKLSPNTQSSVRKTFTAKLQLWANPLIKAATSGDSFDLRQLRSERISIYVGVNPGDLGRLSLLMNLFFTQMFDLNMQQMPEDNVDLKYELLPLMDEFTAMGRMPIMVDSIGFMGGYGIRPMIIVQSMSQLRATYGPDVTETIVTCCGGMVVYAPKEQLHAEQISKKLDNTTVDTKSRSRPRFHFRTSGGGMGGSVSTSVAARPLMNPQEVKQLGRDKEIIFVEDVRPILCDKIWYWKLRVFNKRANLPLPRIAPVEVIMAPPQVSLKKSQKESKDKDGNIIVTTTRNVTAKDMSKLDGLSLIDYNLDASKVELPKGEPVTDEDIAKAFGSFLNAVAAAREP